MKNPTILKDELGLLKADMSAVLKELNLVGNNLKDIYIEQDVALKDLADMRDTILEETARLDDLRGRAVFVNKDLNQYTQDLRNMKNTWETARIKNAQEVKLHLGRIKNFETKVSNLQDSISLLKENYDNNLRIYKQHEEEKAKRLQEVDSDIKEKEAKQKLVTAKLLADIEEDKKITKDRLKREDKIRARESYLVAKEESMRIKEEDLINLSLDLAIVYARLKELYAKVDPTVDLDRLVKQVT